MVQRLVWVLALAACNTDNVKAVVGEQFDTGEGVDDVGPTISHTPVTAAQPINTAVALSASTEDRSGVDSVKIAYQRYDQVDWTRVDMAGDAEGLNWSGSIPGDAVVGSGMRYVLEATDKVGNVSAYPPDGESDPLSFRVDGG